MGITKELWEKFAKSIYDKYFNEEDKKSKGLKGIVISKDEFANEVSQLFGGYSSWRVSEMKKSGSLYGFLFRYDDNHYVINYPALTGVGAGPHQRPSAPFDKKRP